jgi:ubiquinone/menaquinone biosynthesis C-methylase UbiE
MRSIILPLISNLIPKRFIAAQLRQPFGLFGRFIMGDYYLNRPNKKMNLFAIEMLGVQPADLVLDIGFGGGVAIEEMLKTIDTGKINGVDFSQVMVTQAKQKFKAEIKAGKVSIKFADVRELPFDENTFDKICTVNTIYFWEEPLASLQEIKRVLKNDGKLVVGIRSAEKKKNSPFTQYNSRFYTPEAVKNLLTEAGFNEISIEQHQDLQLGYAMIIACT